MSPRGTRSEPPATPLTEVIRSMREACTVQQFVEEFMTVHLYALTDELRRDLLARVQRFPGRRPVHERDLNQWLVMDIAAEQHARRRSA